MTIARFRAERQGMPLQLRDDFPPNELPCPNCKNPFGDHIAVTMVSEREPTALCPTAVFPPDL